MTTRKPNPIHLPSTSIHLENGKKPLENSPLSTSSTYYPTKGYRGVKNKKGGQGETIGKEVDEVDRAPPARRYFRDKPGQGRWSNVDVFQADERPDAGPSQSVLKDTRLIALTEPDHRGVEHRVGETHHNARLSDADVDAIREEFETHPVGHPEHMGYRALAHKWGVGKRTIRDIVNFNRRNAWAAKWKRVAKG